MAGTSNMPPMTMAGPSMAVISPQFCLGYPVDLMIVRKVMTLEEGTFAVTDVKGNIMFRVKGKVFSFHDRRVLLDAAGNPLITFQQKTLSAHRRWHVFRGESTEKTDLLFSVKQSKFIQFRTKLDVILTCNNPTKEEVPDYRVEGSWLDRSCNVFAGKSDTIVAQMHKKHTAESILLGKDTFGVTVYPNVDYAFIATIIVILQEINEDRAD